MLHIDETSRIKPFNNDSLFLQEPQIRIINIKRHQNSQLRLIPRPTLVNNLFFEHLVKKVLVVFRVKFYDLGETLAIIGIEHTSTDGCSERISKVNCLFCCAVGIFEGLVV